MTARAREESELRSMLAMVETAKRVERERLIDIVDNYADVEGDSEHLRPNLAMRLVQEMRQEGDGASVWDRIDKAVNAERGRITRLLEEMRRERRKLADVWQAKAMASQDSAAIREWHLAEGGARALEDVIDKCRG